jgi:hypothetical protein
MLAFLSGFIKLYFFKVSLQSLLSFLIASKALLNLDNVENLREEKEE